MQRIISLLLIFIAIAADARQVSPEEAQNIASEFFNSGSSEANKAPRRALRASRPASDNLGAEPYYIFNAGDNGGFVIISGDTRVKKILGYSDTGSFDTENMPPQLVWLLNEYEKQIQNIPENGKQDPSWQTVNHNYVSEQHVLETANWNQEAPYNSLCPKIGEKETFAGCVATATAIVMKYYEWPQRGIGLDSYEWNGETLSFDFGTQFDWDNMLDNYNGEFSSVQAYAVAKLMKACGIGVHMNYGIDGSAAPSNNIIKLLLTHFNYDCRIEFLSHANYANDEWVKLIKEEIDNGRPVIYSGNNENSGHCFVCDGYDDDNRLHFNWGWGGFANGFFVHDNIDFSEHHINGQGFNNSQSIIRHIQPNKNGSPYSTKLNLAYDGFKMDSEELSNTRDVNIFLPSIIKIDNEVNYTGEVALALTDSDFQIKEILYTTKYPQIDGIVKCRPTVKVDNDDYIAIFERETVSDEWRQLVNYAPMLNDDGSVFIAPSMLHAKGNTLLPIYSNIKYNISPGIDCSINSGSYPDFYTTYDKILKADFLQLTINNRGEYDAIILLINGEPSPLTRKGIINFQVFKSEYEIDVIGIKSNELKNISVNVDRPGNLHTLIDKTDLSIGKIKIDGTMNWEDISYLKSLASWYSLDLSGAVIVKDDGSSERSLPDEFLIYDNQVSEIKLPLNITKIPRECFSGCKSLRNIEVPNGVTTIEDQAFNFTKAVITLPESLETIGNNVFFGNIVICTGITPPDLGNDNGIRFVCVPKEAFEKYKNAPGWSKFYKNGFLNKIGLNIKWGGNSVDEFEFNASWTPELTPVIYPQEEYPEDVIWSIEDTTVCSINPSGCLEALQPGTTTVTVSTQDGKYTENCKVTVYFDPISHMNFTWKDVEIDMNEYNQYHEYLLDFTSSNYDHNKYKNVVFSISDTTIAIVNSYGGVIPIKVGETYATITPKFQQEPMVSDTCRIIVVDSSGIEDILADNGDEVHVYTTTGVLVFEGKYSDAKLSEGLYIVVTKDKQYKKLIR